MELIFNLIAIALIVEITVQVLKEILDNFGVLNTYKNAIVQFLSVVIGLILVFSTGISIFSTLNIAICPIIGQVITGIIISKGSNFVFDMFKKLKEFKDNGTITQKTK